MYSTKTVLIIKNNHNKTMSEDENKVEGVEEENTTATPGEPKAGEESAEEAENDDQSEDEESSDE